MTSTKGNSWLTYVGIALVGIVIGWIISATTNTSLFGGVYDQVQKYFYDGIYVGTTNQFAVSKTGALTTSGTVTIGSSGGAMTQVIPATCALLTSGATTGASSTKAYDCAVTGVVSGDKVFAQPATTTASATGPTWQVIGASASSTSGYVTLNVYNPTSAAATVPLYIASSTALLIVR